MADRTGYMMRYLVISQLFLRRVLYESSNFRGPTMPCLGMAILPTRFPGRQKRGHAFRDGQMMIAL
jgi:hypothetical protein